MKKMKELIKAKKDGHTEGFKNFNKKFRNAFDSSEEYRLYCIGYETELIDLEVLLGTEEFNKNNNK